MKQVIFKRVFILLLICSPLFSSAYYNGDIGSCNATYSGGAVTWAAGNWAIYTGGAWVYNATYTPSPTDTVYILNGYNMQVVAEDSCYRLTVETGASLYVGTNNGSPIYIDIWGDSLTCNGTIGNAVLTTFDGISFDIDGSNCVISGSGTFNGSHIRKFSLVPDTTNLTINLNITLCYGDSSNMSTLTDNSAIYNHESSSTFNITFSAGTTTNLVRYTGAHPCNTNIAISGSDGTKPPRSGTYTINGTVIVSGYTIFSTSAFVPYFAKWIINSGGILETNEVVTDINCGGSCPGGDTVYMYSGSLMEITGAPNATYNTFSLSHNTYYLYPGSTINYSGAGAQFVDVNLSYANLTLSGSGTKTANAGNLNINGNLTINSPDQLALTTSTATINIGGNWTDWGIGGFAEASSTVVFDGTANQTFISNNGQDFANVTINNSGGNVFLDSATKSKMIILPSYLLTFGSGLIVGDTSDGGANLVWIEANATVSGASDNSFVYGRVERSGTTAFTFPVGKGSEYRPISIGATASAIIWFAQYFKQDPDVGSPDSYPTPQVTAPIDSVSRCEYWTLVPNAATSATVTLSWDTYSCGVTDLATLLIAKDSTSIPTISNWNSLGAVSTAGSVATGTITTSSAISFNTKLFAYTLSTSSAFPNNPLPVSLLSFTAQAERSNVLLAWTTASEINDNYFTVEKTVDGDNYIRVGEEKGAGTSNSEIKYTFIDPTPFYGVSYYRLKQTDYNGNYSYSQLAAINFTTQQTTVITLYPNPTPDRAYFYITWETMPLTNIREKTYILQVFDVSGREAIPSQVINFSYGNLQMLDVSELPKGVYELQLNSPSDIQRTSLIKE